MPNLSQNFRKSFLDYSKNPNSIKNKKNLVNSALAIFEDLLKQSSEADVYIIHLHNIIKRCIDGLKLTPDTAKKLDDFIRELTFSDSKKETQAFHVLNIALNLNSPKKFCLREVIKNLLILKDKLKNEDTIISNKKLAGSFFISDIDVSNVKAKKSIIDGLIEFTSKEILEKSSEDVPDNHIDYLSENQCGQILSSLLQRINLILNAQDNHNDIKENAGYMSNLEKRTVLKIHSFNDKYFFTFLAKMVKKIKEAFGIKTSAENLLENLANEAKNLGVIPKVTSLISDSLIN